MLCFFVKWKPLWLCGTTCLWCWKLRGPKTQTKKQECLDFLWTVSRLLCVCMCVYMAERRPVFCLQTATVAGRIFLPQVIFRMHTHTHTHRRNVSFSSLAFFLFKSTMCRQGSRKTMGQCSCSDSAEAKGQRRDGHEVRLHLTDLMRGTLSSVQHKDGPLCKYSSSSHDWLYNLKEKTTKQTPNMCGSAKANVKKNWEKLRLY